MMKLTQFVVSVALLFAVGTTQAQQRGQGSKSGWAVGVPEPNPHTVDSLLLRINDLLLKMETLEAVQQPVFPVGTAPAQVQQPRTLELSGLDLLLMIKKLEVRVQQLEHWREQERKANEEVRRGLLKIQKEAKERKGKQ